MIILVLQNNWKTFFSYNPLLSPDCLSKGQQQEERHTKKLYCSSENKPTSLLFQLSKYYYKVDGRSLYKHGFDNKLWECQRMRTVTKAGASAWWLWLKGTCSPQVCNNHFRQSIAPLALPGMYGSCSERGENYHCVGKLLLHFCPSSALLPQPHTVGTPSGCASTSPLSLRMHGLGKGPGNWWEQKTEKCGRGFVF